MARLTLLLLILLCSSNSGRLRADTIELTPNFIIFVEDGCEFDHALLQTKLEEFYAYYIDSLEWLKPSSRAATLRMMINVRNTDDGTAYGGDYEGVIGAMWIAPNRLQDSTLNCVAHELGHAFQCQIQCDGDGEAWGGSGFFEMTSQWMLWRVNPNWILDEQWHWEEFMKQTDKAFLHIDNIYHSPFVIEYWAQQHGLTFIAELYREGRRDEDPVDTYKRLTGMGQEEFCRDMLEGYKAMLTWDVYPKPW